MLNYYDFFREEENKARRLTTPQNVNKTRNESDGINPSRVSHACSRSPSPSLFVALFWALSHDSFWANLLGLWALRSACFFFIDFLKGTQNANNNNNSEHRTKTTTTTRWTLWTHYRALLFSFFLLLNIFFHCFFHFFVFAWKCLEFFHFVYTYLCTFWHVFTVLVLPVNL